MRIAVCLVVGGLTAAALLFGYYRHLMAQWAPLPESAVEQTPAPDMIALFPGVRLPPTRAAEDADLTEDAEVIGVCVAGHARAYAIESMTFPPWRHVVNDLLGGYPVSVTYCEKRNCARVFAGESTGVPLELDVGGLTTRQGMLLRVHGINYAQGTGENIVSPVSAPIPYRHLPHARTTWAAWRKAHPDTDVYRGDPSEPAEAADPPTNPFAK